MSIKISENFLKCLTIANVSKLGWCLIMYIKRCTNNFKPTIEYNADRINKECFYSGPKSNQAERALKHLVAKNIIFYNQEERNIKINYNARDWNLTEKQHERILSIL